MNANVETIFAPQIVLGLSPAVYQPGRVPKKTLVEQAASQTVDATLITRAVAHATVQAVLRADNLKIPNYVDEHRRIDDIAVFHVELSDAASSADTRRLVELLHRSMPRPLILFISSPRDGESVSLALTHTNLSDSDRATSVIEQSLVVPLKSIASGALRIDGLNRTDLWALYRDLIRVVATEGRPASASLTANEALHLRGRLTALNGELAVVVRDAKKERSHAGRIRLNNEAKVLRQHIEEAEGALYSPTSAQRPKALTTNR
ncbi:DUF4391 domain-containing protein [Rhodococcoides fascians]|jgi:hypothetical protein|uniref:DUF4391 domain-containing protein n=1 Tax=Rhodococcoides fascians TaxID=1828 RepID=UPI00050CC10D|nr:DUF4391 domain-containing protein [Rhodococcus fascians]WQH29999.1 DUF4391 domain-containing protein [Rhodococcus fascians]